MPPPCDPTMGGPCWRRRPAAQARAGPPATKRKLPPTTIRPGDATLSRFVMFHRRHATEGGQAPQYRAHSARATAGGADARMEFVANDGLRPGDQPRWNHPRRVAGCTPAASLDSPRRTARCPRPPRSVRGRASQRPAPHAVTRPTGRSDTQEIQLPSDHILSQTQRTPGTPSTPDTVQDPLLGELPEQERSRKRQAVTRPWSVPGNAETDSSGASHRRPCQRRHHRPR